MTPNQMIRQLVLAKAKGINNPILNNLIDLANKGDANGVNNIARNMFKEKGLDFDKELNSFKNTINKFQ